MSKALGIQGEIGHLPIHFEFRGVRYESSCDCGADRHLNAYCSGRGISHMAPRLLCQEAVSLRESCLGSAGLDLANFDLEILRAALDSADAFSGELLDGFTKPVADLVAVMLTVDPLIERIFLVGGVVNALSPHYRTSLIRNVIASKMYVYSVHDTDFADRTIHEGGLGDTANLTGAALATLQATHG